MVQKLSILKAKKARKSLFEHMQCNGVTICSNLNDVNFVYN